MNANLVYLSNTPSTYTKSLVSFSKSQNFVVWISLYGIVGKYLCVFILWFEIFTPEITELFLKAHHGSDIIIRHAHYQCFHIVVYTDLFRYRRSPNYCQFSFTDRIVTALRIIILHSQKLAQWRSVERPHHPIYFYFKYLPNILSSNHIHKIFLKKLERLYNGKGKSDIKLFSFTNFCHSFEQKLFFERFRFRC